MEVLSSKELMDAIRAQREVLQEKQKHYVLMSELSIKKIIGTSNTREHLEAKLLFKNTFTTNNSNND